MEHDTTATRYTDAPTTVRVTTTREALWVAEELPELSVEEAGENLVMTIPARNYDFIVRFLALMGQSVISIEPPEVAERVSSIFATLATAYTGRDEPLGLS